MVKSIIINSSNFVQGSGNRFVYQFPNTARFQAGTGIGVAGIAIYNSLQNITVARGNNTLVLSWLGITYNFVISPGYYSVSDLNFYLQNQCILNGLYCTSNNGASNVYFIELAINSDLPQLLRHSDRFPGSGFRLLTGTKRHVELSSIHPFMSVPHLQSKFRELNWDDVRHISAVRFSIQCPIFIDANPSNQPNRQSYFLL